MIHKGKEKYKPIKDKLEITEETLLFELKHIAGYFVKNFIIFDRSSEVKKTPKNL
jgi:hypothetical protein